MVILSFGLFTAIPFAHAAHRSDRPVLWRRTGFSAATAVALLLIQPSSMDQPGGLTEVRSTIGTLAAIVLVVAACL